MGTTLTPPQLLQFIVHEVPGQEIEVELFDKDPDQDDLLGRWESQLDPTLWGQSPWGGIEVTAPWLGALGSQPPYGNIGITAPIWDIGVTVPRGDIGVTAPSSQLTPHPLSPPPRMKLDFGEVLKARVLEEVRRGLWCWGVGVGWRGKDGAVLTPLSPQWFPLQDGGRGRLHLRLEWLTLLPDASKLEQVRG